MPNIIKQTGDLYQQILTDNMNNQDNEQNTALHRLLNQEIIKEENLVESVKFVISKGARIDIQNNCGDTVCHLAAKRKVLQALWIFLQHDWDVNCQNNEGNTVLHCILMDSQLLGKNPQYLKIIDCVLKQTYLQLVRNKQGKTPLHIAAEYNHSQILNGMLAKPVNINVMDKKGNTVLNIFLTNLSQKGFILNRENIEIVKKLISMGASPVDCHSSEKLSPLHLALKLGNKEIVLLFLEATFDVNKQNIRKCTILHYLLSESNLTQTDMVDIVKKLISKGVTTSIPNNDRDTVCHLAAKKKLLKVLQTLLQSKCNVNYCNQKGNTVLHCILIDSKSFCTDPQYFEIVDYILNQGASMLIKNVDGRSPLFIAIENNHCTVLKQMLSRLVNIDAVNDEIDTILYNFVEKVKVGDIILDGNSTEIIKKIISLGANPIARSSSATCSPLHLALKAGNKEITLLMSESEFDVNEQDIRNNTLLHYLLNYSTFAETDKMEVAVKFIAKGAKVDIQNKNGNTACHLAAAAKLLKVLWIFLQCKWDVNSCNSEGNTVLHCILMDSKSFCTSPEYFKIVDYILQQGTSKLIKNIHGRNPLFIAIENKHDKVLVQMLSEPVDIDAVNGTGDTILYTFMEQVIAGVIYLNESSIEIIKKMITLGAHPIACRFSVSCSPLHLALKLGNKEIILLFLEPDFSIDEQSKTKHSILCYLLNESKLTEIDMVEVAQKLISKGAKVDIQNNDGDTVCHLAAKRKLLQVLWIFLQREWAVNCCDREGNTVLHYILMDSKRFRDNPEYIRIVDHILKHKNLQIITNRHGITPHHIAADNNQTTILNDMLSKYVDINAQDINGNSILNLIMKNLVNEHNAPSRNDIQVIEKMLALGANPVITSFNNNLSPLLLALTLHNREISLLMLQCKIDLKKFDETHNMSILHFICGNRADCSESEQLRHAQVAKFCIKNGATADVRDGDGKTPLHWAVFLRHKVMVKTLLKHGANPNLVDNQGGTILENLMKHVMYKKMMTKYHSNRNLDYYRMDKIQITRNIERDFEIAKILLSKKAVAENVSKGQVSIFHYCAINSHLNMLSEIISYSKDPNIRDSCGVTILQALLTHNLNTNAEVEKKVTEIVEKLLSKGAIVTDVNKQGETLLHLAAKYKHLAVSKLLLKKSVNIADLDKDGNSVLHFLCMLQSKNHESVEKKLTDLFISKGCDLNAKNNKGMNPFLSAVQSGSINMVRILKKLNANIDCHESLNLSTPIHLAAENNHQEVIDQLIKYGVDVNIRRQKDRKTALHLSVTHNLPKVTRLLLEAGADTYMKDSEAKTPLHWACWSESIDNINELLEFGADLNVEDNSNVTPLMLTRRSSDAWTKLRYHVIKLKAAKIPVSRRNESYLQKCNKENGNFSTTAEEQFKTLAMEEFLKMKKVPIGPRTSLADVLLMSADKLSIFKNNENFKKLPYSDDSIKKYPIYADLVKACYRKGIIRSDLMLSAKDALRKILQTALPDFCCDVIFYYLDNIDLDSLSKAAKINLDNDDLDSLYKADKIKITKRKNYSVQVHQLPLKKIKSTIIFS